MFHAHKHMHRGDIEHTPVIHGKMFVIKLYCIVCDKFLELRMLAMTAGTCMPVKECCVFVHCRNI